MKKIDAEKLTEHIKSGAILEFDSDETCMWYFNTYDFQNLTSIEEMKEMQGEYGFNIGDKRYYILNDYALDVYVDDQRNTEFTDDELYLLSEGLLALIGNTTKAMQYTYDRTALEALNVAMNKYSALNSKVCGMMK